MSPKSRSHGEGSVRARQIKGGTVYDGAIQVGTGADGKRLMYYCTADDKHECRRLLR